MPELCDKMINQEEMFVKKYTLSITYVILLALCVPVGYLYICFLSILPISWDALMAWADSFGRILLLVLLFLLPVGIYWLVIFIFGVMNIVKSFRIYKTGDAVGCINSMLIHKYGLVVFFAVNFIYMLLFYLLLPFVLIIGTRGLALLAAPVLLPLLIASFAFTVFAMWLAIVPGAVYGIQVIRFTVREKKTGTGAAIWHGILQFVFLADVLDAMYLAVKKWGRGKKSSAVIGILYVLVLAGIIWVALQVFG